ncbi:MAG: ATP-binding cassette domain-containing protein [Sulfuricurvum sp.]|jgi:phospholipid/cholesterol/gamma-HCH transport system ATP-binding protein|uniref:ABC transporter ATP-binding protein n=1 Tax=Sulfuricurvum sp. TaxID=2025608 RepID=UPI0025D6F2BD|nr:ATP-binding cassette domain-containing protein [Sulfuricurvum sp.]MCK9373715.1 ATP-binding cassette domain-containing protein [Sulfuricurvum sp.]
MNPVIKVENIVTKLGNRLIHDKISFEVNRSEIFGILGGSGAGKSTLIRQLLMLETFQSGTIEILGTSLHRITEKKADILRQKWAVLFQFGALFSSLSVLENIALPLIEYTRLPKELIDNMAMTKLSMVGLPPSAASLYPGELSGGMKKRVGLARALALDPELLFLDEPTSGLDPASAEAFDRLIVELRDILGFSVIIVTHDLDTIKSTLDRFIVLHDHKICFEGSYGEALQSDVAFLKDFLKVT